MRRELDERLKESRKKSAEAERELKRTERSHARQAAVVARDLKKDNLAKKKRGDDRRARARSTAEAIGYDLMFKNGLADLGDGLFSVTMSFDDISYQLSPESTQKGIMRCMARLYNYLSPDTTLRFNLVNEAIPAEEAASRVWYDPGVQDSANARLAAETLNGILNEKVREGVSNIRRWRTMTVTLPAENADEAWRRLARVRGDIGATLKELGCETSLVDGTERLRLIQGLLRPGKPFTFDYDALSPWSALTTKDFIAPMTIDWAPYDESTYCRIDDLYHQVLLIRDYQSPLTDRAFADLADLDFPLNLSWSIQPFDKAAAQNLVTIQSGWVDKEVIDEQKRALNKGYDYNILPPETARSRREISEVLGKLSGSSENLFSVTAVVHTYAATPEELTERVKRIIRVGRAAGLTVELLDYYQREAVNTALPLGGDTSLPYRRTLLTSQLCILVPFATQELDQPGGTWYYSNRVSGNLIFGNRARLASPVGFISGMTGSGKGFFIKNEIMGTYLSKTEDQVIVLDRQGEYTALAEFLGGTVASFGVEHSSHMNPLCLPSTEDRDFEAQLALKSDAMIAQAAASASESGAGFSDEERSILQRCVESVCRHDLGREPVLSDLYDELRAQPEPQAARLALRYERYISGAMDFFNHPSNIDFTKRLVTINYRDLPESMTVFALIAACEAIRQQMYVNDAAGRRTWLYIEEIESLFRYPTVLNYFSRFANEARKFGMYLTGITQSVDSMRKNDDVSAIVKNAEFYMLFHQSHEDALYWEGTLGLSKVELDNVGRGTKRGDGLLIFGGAHIPVRGDFPRGNILYDLYTTDPDDGWTRRGGGE